MKIFQKVAWKYLKKNKIRTMATIAGIMLSAAMICGVTTFVVSMDHYVMENAIHNTGDWQAAALEVDWQTYENLSKQEEITNLVCAQRQEYAEIAQLDYDISKRLYYLLGVEEEFLETMNAQITSGRFPRKRYEILVPENLYELTGLKYEIGDKLILGTGQRTYKGVVLGQQDYVTTGRVDKVERTRLYTIVGFYDGLSYKIETAASPGYTLFTYFEDRPIFRDGYHLDLYFKIKNSGDIYQFTEKNGLTPTYNAEVLGVMGILQNGESNSMTIALIVVIMCLIFLGSIALIYNMFSISISERTKQFGLLSSLGAMPSQIRKMVWFEAMVVSAIGIPIGIAVGIGGIGVALSFIGDRFEALGYSIPMTVHVSVPAVLIAVLIAFLTVVVSAWIPSKRAMHASIIESIKQNKDIYQSEKKEKTYKWTYKIFGLPGVLANQYYSRSKRKYRAAIVSLFVSCILFVLVSFFTENIMKIVKHNFDSNSYDLAFYYTESDLGKYEKDEFFELLSQQEGIVDAAYISPIQGYRAELDKKYLNDWALTNIGTITSPSKLNPDIVTVNVNIAFVQDEVFVELLEKNNLEIADYMNAENPKALVIDGVQNPNSNSSVNLLAGDGCSVKLSRVIKIEIREEDILTFEKVEKMINDGLISAEEAMELLNAYDNRPSQLNLDYELQAGEIIYDYPYYITQNDVFLEDGLMFLYPTSARRGEFKYLSADSGIKYYYKILSGEETEGYEEQQQVAIEQDDAIYLVDAPASKYQCKFLSDDYDASYEALCQIAEKFEIETSNIINNAEQIEKENSLLSIIQVFAYGFIALISLVAVVNVFHTIFTNINLRRREFAVLKSIGMGENGLNRMTFVECMLIGAKALLYGLPTALLVTLLSHWIVLNEYGIAYRFPWISVGAAVGGIVIIVGITMLYIVAKRKNENVLEALKNETI